MKILISNDDGINAAGIKLLEDIALGFSEDVTVVAPDSNRSGAGHSLTLNDPLRLHRHDDKHFSVNGTPTDSVVVGMKYVLGEKPDFLFSGINNEANLAEDITYSGTVAATMEACLLGIPAIAFSQQIGKDGSAPWEIARTFAPLVIKEIFAKFKFKEKMLLNINFPAVSLNEVKGYKVTHQGFREIADDHLIQSIDPRGNPYFWIGSAEHRHLKHDRDSLDSDIGAVNNGYISITPISLDLTDYSNINNLKEVF